MNAILQDATFRQLRDFVHEQCGIYIPDTKKYLLEKKLLELIERRGLSGFEEYLRRLKSGEDGEVSSLFDVVTTHETYFFREPNQLAVLTDVILPDMIRANNGAVRIWSSACSTGEEPYTIAMLIKEKRPHVRPEIIASDISAAAIEAARRGIYGSYSLRNLPQQYLERYFKKSNAGHEIDKEIKNSVRLMQINLIDEHRVRSMVGMDVIFCRNVLIYFDEKVKKKVVSSLYDSLRPGGYLFIGTSESLHMVTRAFRPVVFNKVVVYQRA